MKVVVAPEVSEGRNSCSSRNSRSSSSDNNTKGIPALNFLHIHEDMVSGPILNLLGFV